jgi:hypothetical protein
MRIDAERSAYDPCSPFFASRPEQLNRGIHCPSVHACMHERGQKIPLDNQLPDLPLLSYDFEGS